MFKVGINIAFLVELAKPGQRCLGWFLLWGVGGDKARRLFNNHCTCRFPGESPEHTEPVFMTGPACNAKLSMVFRHQLQKPDLQVPFRSRNSLCPKHLLDLGMHLLKNPGLIFGFDCIRQP